MATRDAATHDRTHVEWAARVQYVGRVATATVRGFLTHNGLTTSAALAFYLLLSLLPFLIFLTSALSLLPVRHLASRMIQLAWHFVPASTMPMVETMLNSTMQTSHGLISIGFILAVIAASNAFAVLASLLNTIYEVKEGPGFWKTRLSAVGTTMVVGAMMFVALSAMLLGPHFGGELEHVFGVSHTFTMVWPTLRWVLAVTCALASIKALYYLGVNRKHTHAETAASGIGIRADHLDRQFRGHGPVFPSLRLYQCDVRDADFGHHSCSMVADHSGRHPAGRRAECAG